MSKNQNAEEIVTYILLTTENFQLVPIKAKVEYMRFENIITEEHWNVTEI